MRAAVGRVDRHMPRLRASQWDRWCMSYEAQAALDATLEKHPEILDPRQTTPSLENTETWTNLPKGGYARLIAMLFAEAGLTATTLHVSDGEMVTALLLPGERLSDALRLAHRSRGEAQLQSYAAGW